MHTRLARSRSSRRPGWACPVALFTALLVAAACVPMAPAADGAAPRGGHGYGGGGEYGEYDEDGEYGGYDEYGNPTGGGAGAGRASAGGGTYCERQCTLMARCAGDDYQGCLEGCEITGSDLPPEYADQLDCDAIRREREADRAWAADQAKRGGTSKGNGSQCAARGIDDCPAMTVCCHRLGRCESPGVCNMPTR